jgi:carboxyl-terminal processing protease
MRSRAVVVMAVLSAALVTGGWLMERGIRGAGAPADGAHLFDDVMTHISRFYVDTIPADSLYRRAVDGMLMELRDPHSVYLDPARLKRLTERTSGNYAGLGIEMDVRDGWITIIAPLPGSPAERAGIQTGDRIVEIDGKPTFGRTPDEATRALRGPAGSTVELLVERSGVDERMPFRLTRANIHRAAVRRTALLRPTVGYVDVSVFSDSTAAEVARAVDSLGRRGMRSLILDMRSNPGGLLDQGVSVADLFLDPAKEIVSMRGRTREVNRSFVDRAQQRWPDLPIVVLVDEGSASAAEIVAGALQDHDRAALVGATTYGKGSAQSLFTTVSGGALKLTTALWYTPSGRSIDNRPDSTAAAEIDDGDAAPRDTVPLSGRTKSETDGGRTVYGGGGITPDVIVRDTAGPQRALELQRALGSGLPRFRDAVTAYALALRGARVVAGPGFVVTPAMRAELYRRMAQRGVVMDSATYARHARVVDQLLTYEIARYVFGTDAEFLRTARDDAVITEALSLLAGVKGNEDLLARATARQALQARELAAQDSSARR